MGTFIGFLELFVWVVAVVALAAGITFTVIKLFPSREKSVPADTSSAPPGS